MGGQRIERLAPHVFKHRIECAPGVDDPVEVISDAVAPQIERLTKLSMKR